MAQQSSSGFNAEACANMFKGAKMPKIDFESALSAHKKNLEALSEAQKSCFECAKSLSETQNNFMRQSFEDMKNHWQDMLSSKSMEEKVQAHTEQLKNFFEKSVSHGRTMTEQFMKSHQTISSAFQKRFHEGVGEAREAMKKHQPTSSKH